MKKLSKGMLMAALITGTLASTTALAAEPELNEFSLDEMVITATRTLKDMKEVPSSVSVITEKDIANKNANSINDVLEMLPGVMLGQSESYDPAEKLQLRGFGTSGILVLVDGVQQNNTYNGTANTMNIPVENIERIEVVRGAASSIYGGHAAAGVINIITKDSPKEKGARVYGAVSYGSNTTWKKSVNVDARVNEKFSFGVGYEDRRTHGYPGYYVTAAGAKGTGTYNAKLPQLSDGKYVLGSRGRKESENTAYTAYVKYDFDKSKSLKYAYQKAETEWRYKNAYSNVKDASGNQIFSGKATTQNGDVVTLKASSFYGYDNFYYRDTHNLVYKDVDNNFHATLNYVDNKKYGFTSASVPSSYTGTDFAGAGEYSDHPGKTYNFNMEKAWDKLGGRHTVVAGMDFKQENMEQKRHYMTAWHDESSKAGQYALDSGKVRSYALYLQDEYKLSDPLSLYVGARFDHYEKGSGTFWNTETGLDEKSASEKYNELSPKVALAYKADADTNYYVSYGHSFNPPSMYKIYRYSEFSKYWYVPNPDLDPETSNTFEIGMKKKLAEKTNVGVTMFHIKTKDAIIASGLLPGETFKGKGVKKYINADSETRKGVELEATHDFSDKFGVYTNYTWQQGKYKSAGSSNADFDIPKHIFHLGVKYDAKPWNAYVDCEYVSACQPSDSATEEYGAYDQYFIVNTGVSYEFSKGLTLQFKINNLFDREFYAKEINAGRMYTVGLRYKF